MTSIKFRYFINLFLVFLIIYLLFNGRIVPDGFWIRYFLELMLVILLVLLAINTLQIRIFPLKVLLLIVFAPIAFVGIPWMFYETYRLYEYNNHGNVDESFVLIATSKYKDYEINAYRTNSGAMTSFGVVVRSERKFIPGLLMTERLYDNYRCMYVDLNIKSDTLIIIPDNEPSLREKIIIK